AQWMFDGIWIAGVVDETAHTVTASYTFTAAAVYSVRLMVTNDLGASSIATEVGGLDATVVIYDPSAGFVTGGGWIDSPPGAHVAAPSVAKKAGFAFESKYTQGSGVPTGDTEFNFKAADLKFTSTSYDWLVVSGATAQFQGSGVVTGSNTAYSFILTAVDGD